MLLPEPLSPTIPIKLPEDISALIFFNINGLESVNLKLIFLNSILPSRGGIGGKSSPMISISLGLSIISDILSRDNVVCWKFCQREVSLNIGPVTYPDKILNAIS